MKNSDNKYNELDKFFQDRLSEDISICDGWNVPASNVLDDAIDIVNNNRSKGEKRNLLFLLLLLSLGLMFMVIRNSVNIYRIQHQISLNSEKQSVVNSDNRIITVKKKINQSQKNTTTKQTEINTIINNQVTSTTISKALTDREDTKFEQTKTSENISKTTIKSTSSKQNQSLNTLAEKSSSTKIANTRNVKKTVSIQPINSNSEVIDHKKIISLSYNPPQIQTQHINNTKSNIGLSILPGRLNFSSVSNLPTIDNKLESINNFQLLSHQKQILPTDILGREQAKIWTVYAFSGINLLKQRMTNIPSDSSFVLGEYDKKCLGFESGVGVEYQFAPRLNLNLTLGYSKINNRSVFSDQINYNAANETVQPDGTILYNEDFPIQTTVEAYNRSYQFEVHDNDIMQVDNVTRINQSSQNFLTSLALEYSLLSKNKFNVKIGLGAGVSYSKKFIQRLDVNISSNINPLYDDSFAPTVSTDVINRLLSSGLSSTSINYQISPKISLGLHIDYFVNLSSLRKINEVNNSKTFNQGFRTFLTTGYRF